MENKTIIKLAILALIILLFYILLFGGNCNKNETFQNEEKFKEMMDPEDKKELFRLMKIIHETFNRHGLWYVIGYGTLLGAVRHRDKIPWDDDIDIIVKHKDLTKLEEVLKDLDNQGLKTDKTWKLYKVYSKERKDVFIDIFIMDNLNEKASRCLPNKKECIYASKIPMNKWWNDEWWFPYEYFDSRKIYEIGDIKVWGPTDPSRILSFWYGKDFLTSCATQKYDHKTSQYVIPTTESCPKDLPKPQL